MLKYTVKNSIHIYCCKERRQIQPSNLSWLLHFFPHQLEHTQKRKGWNPPPPPPPKEKKGKTTILPWKNYLQYLQCLGDSSLSLRVHRRSSHFARLSFTHGPEGEAKVLLVCVLLNLQRNETHMSNLHQTSPTLGNMFTCIHSPQQQVFPHTVQFHTVETPNVDEVCVGSEKEDAE